MTAVNRPLKEWNVDCHLADITTGTPVAFAPIPVQGVITRVYASQYAGVSGGATVVTVAKADTLGGTSTTLGTLTFTSGNGAGYVTAMTELSGLGKSCNEGDVVSFTSDGGSANGTVAATFTTVVRRGS